MHITEGWTAAYATTTFKRKNWNENSEFVHYIFCLEKYVITMQAVHPGILYSYHANSSHNMSSLETHAFQYKAAAAHCKFQKNRNFCY